MLTAVPLVDAPGRPLLLLGPSLGTSVQTLWSRCAALLGDRYHVVGWDLPGHGRSAPATAPFRMADLAQAVVALADEVRPGERFGYAGDSIGGAVGLHLLLDFPGRVRAAVLLCTGAMIGGTADWQDRAATVRAHGTQALVPGAVERWFGPGFADREPGHAATLLDALRAVEPHSYALACAALAGFDVRDRLGEITAPVLAVAGAADRVTPVPVLAELADGVRHGRLVRLDGVAHQAPAERPAAVAALLHEHLGTATTVGEVRAAGLAVRRAVLGDAHVDRTTAATTPLTRTFDQFITEYAWGGVWTRPGLDRRTRSVVTLTALVALGHHEELAMHVRAARTNGLTDDEISEVLLQTAIYCGVPAANSAFRIAQRVLTELDEDRS